MLPVISEVLVIPSDRFGNLIHIYIYISKFKALFCVLDATGFSILMHY